MESRRNHATCVAVALAAFALLIPAGAMAATREHSIWSIGGNGQMCPTSLPDCGDGGPATKAPISFPEGVAVDGAGDVFTVDWSRNQIREISPRGVITSVVGDGTACQNPSSCGDGGPAISAQLSAPTGIALDGRGNLYIADAGNNEIRMVSPQGTITRFAGTGIECTGVTACGDGGLARNAQLTSPDGVAVDRAGNVYIADTGDNEIRKVARDGTISTVAGNGSQCVAAPACGDGQSATNAQLNFPEAVTLDSSGHLFIADNGDNEIREVVRGKIVRLAGTGIACAAAPACGDGGAATSAQLNLPEGVAVDGAGNVYVADWGDNEVRVVSKRGVITRLTGTGAQCVAAPACGDPGAATSALLSSPHAVNLDAAGNVYVSDTFDNEIRLIPATLSAPASAGSGSSSVSLLAFGTHTAAKSVSLRYLVSRAARVSAYVRQGSGRDLLITRQGVDSGLGEVNWNRHLGLRNAPHGRYTLTVTATVGRTTISSTAQVSL